jgi:hypothetical protein
VTGAQVAFKEVMGRLRPKVRRSVSSWRPAALSRNESVLPFVFTLGNMEEHEEAVEPADPPSCCGVCEMELEWEQVEAGRGERWLAVCGCGMPWAFFPTRPDHQPQDPLRLALLGRRTRAKAADSPPWIRVFQITSRHPWWLPWRHVARRCAGCGQRVTFAVWTRPAPGHRALSVLCLACGRATSEYLYSGGRVSELPVSGSEWSPPCVAVARLRRAVFYDPGRGRQG